MDKDIALQNLIDIRDTLAELHITHFLIDGTLLGLIRDGGFIPHDQDTDIGVMFISFTRDKVNMLKNSLENKGFELHHTYGDFDNNYELAFTRNGVKTDLFFYREDGDNYVFHAFHASEVITYSYPKELLDTLTIAYLYDRPFNIPQNAEKVLEAKYGEDWRTPKTDWDWAYSPKNRVVKKPIIFTVGCFDTLHEGHVNLLEKMREEIGINSYSNPNFYVLIHDDASIYKNKKRFPVQTLAHRMHNLDALGVNHIIEVHHSDPTPDIKKFVESLPNNMFIYMRGDDWQDFPGKKYIESMHIPIKYISYTKGVSSTEIRNNLK